MLGMLQDPVTGAQLGRSPVGGPHRIRRPGRAGEAAAAGGRVRPDLLAPRSRCRWRGRWPTRPPGRSSTPRTGGRCELVIEYAEERVFASRSGKGGCVQEDVRGVVAAAFDHWDSRAGDPQLHTHVVVMNRVQTLDGVWRTIDSKALFRWTVGAVGAVPGASCRTA